VDPLRLVLIVISPLQVAMVIYSLLLMVADGGAKQL